jgi:hypothetical protein
MAEATLLLARSQRFLLFGRDQGFHLLATLLAKVFRLLMLLLWRQRRIGADGLDLRTGLALNRPALFHDRLFNAGLLPAGIVAAPRGAGLAGGCAGGSAGLTARWRRSLGGERQCASEQRSRAENVAEHGPGHGSEHTGPEHEKRPPKISNPGGAEKFCAQGKPERWGMRKDSTNQLWDAARDSHRRNQQQLTPHKEKKETTSSFIFHFAKSF